MKTMTPWQGNSYQIFYRFPFLQSSNRTNRPFYPLNWALNTNPLFFGIPCIYKCVRFSIWQHPSWWCNINTWQCQLRGQERENLQADDNWTEIHIIKIKHWLLTAFEVTPLDFSIWFNHHITEIHNHISYIIFSVGCGGCI